MSCPPHPTSLGATSRSKPSPTSLGATWQVQALSDERVVQLAGGGAHSTAVTADGDLYTWGKNLNGQLGTGDVATSSSPLPSYHPVADTSERHHPCHVAGDVAPCPAPTKLAALAQRVVWAACGGAHTACLVRVRDEDVEDAQIDGATSRSTAASARSARSAASSAGGGTNRTTSTALGGLRR